MSDLKNKRQRPSERRGTVLLIVAVIVMLLSLAAYKYMLEMQTENLAAAINGDRIQATQSANSSRDLLMMMLEQTRAKRDALGGVENNPAYFAGDSTALMGDSMTMGSVGTSTKGQIRDIPFGLIAYSTQEPQFFDGQLAGTTEQLRQKPTNLDSQSIDSRTDPTASLTPPTRYGAINESSKLHLMKLLEFEAAEPGAGADALLALPGMDRDTAESLMDWIDSDEEPRAGGAEAEFYSRLRRPIVPRNGMPPDMDELLFVKGVDSWKLFGTQTQVPASTAFALGGVAVNGSSPNGFGSPSQSASAFPTSKGSSASGSNSAATLDPDARFRPWIDFLTVYSAERNESYTGDHRVFLNSDNLAELHEQLSAKLSKEWADFIVLYRQFGAAEENATEGNELQQSDQEEITIQFETPPSVFIQSPFDLLGVSVVVPVPDNEGEGSEEGEKKKPRIVESPGGADVETLSVELVEILDAITVVPAKRISGRVDLQTASQEVLACLPGLSSETAKSIVEARDGDGTSFSSNDNSASRRHPIWLLLESVVELETMKMIAPHLTCGGDVFRAQVWGRSSFDATPRSAMVRFETVLDASNGSCRPVYYRELDAPMDEIKVLTKEEFASLGLTTTETSSANSSGEF